MFNHSTTKFPLTGKHTINAQCHVNGQFAGTPTECSGCHLPDFQKTANPNHSTAGFPTTCAACHTTTQWRAKFDHNKTKFALTGSHASARAPSATSTGSSRARHDCAGCHLPDFQKTTNPNHVSAGFPTTCTTCHTTTQWQAGAFNHNKTKFALTGRHSSNLRLVPRQRAVHWNYDRLCRLPLARFPEDGESQSQHRRVPNHVRRMSHDDAVAGAVFNHDDQVPANGQAHGSMHAVPRERPVRRAPTDCAGCHLPDFQKTTNPNHVSAGFPTTCTTCHNDGAMARASFDHNKTKFALTGSHSSAQCAQCHVNVLQVLRPSAPAVTSPIFRRRPIRTTPRRASRRPARRATRPCNGGAVFDHHRRSSRSPGSTPAPNAPSATSAVSALELRPTARAVTSPISRRRPTRTTPRRASPPPARRATRRCVEGAGFNHSTTKFPLTGKHTSTQCAQCHVNGKFAGTPTECAGCHLPDFQKTTNPTTPRLASQRPARRATRPAWRAVFNHSTTKFPLTGKHTSTQCAQCHVNGKFTGTPTECAGCHLPDFQKTTNPNHDSAGFPTTCTTCHTTGVAAR